MGLSAHTCGCGNFLIIAYRELRLLETEIIKILYSHPDGDIQQSFHSQDLSKIDVDSFYGIEIEEFPARIAEVSMKNHSLVSIESAL